MFEERFLSNHVKNMKGGDVVYRVDINVPVKNKIMTKKHFKLNVYAEIIDKAVKDEIIPVVMTHLGNKEDGPEKFLPYLEQMYKILNEKTKCSLLYAPDLVSEETRRIIKEAKIGDAVFIGENIRNHKDEKGCKSEDEMLSSEIVKFYSKICHFFVNDAPAAFHRGDTTIKGLALALPAFLGYQAEKEMKAMDKIINSDGDGITYIVLGGEKDKLEMIEPLLNLKNTRIFFAGVPGEIYALAQTRIENFSKKDVDLLSKRHDDLNLMNRIINNHSDRVEGPSGFREYDGKIACINEESEEQLIKNLIDSNVKRVLFIGPPDRYEIENEDYCRIKNIVTPLRKTKKDIYAMGGNTVEMFEKADYTQEDVLFFTGGGANVAYLGGNPAKLPGLHPFMHDEQLKADSIHDLK